MISNTFNIILKVLININFFLIDNNIKSNQNAYKNKQKVYNLAVK